MALSKPLPIPVLTKEDTNFLRLSDLVIRVSPRAVRTLFDKHFHPGGLHIYLNTIKTKLEALQKKRVMNQSQLDILYPPAGTTQVTSSDMDLPLMLIFFRNFTKLKLIDSLPPFTDTSEGDDLSRIRQYRNFIAHSADGKIDDKRFSNAWTEMCQAIQRIGGRSFKDECDALLVAELDSTYRDVYLNFLQTERRVTELETSVQKLELEQKDTVPSNIRGLMSDEINRWKIDNAKFYVTSATTAIKEIIKTHPFVVITGSPAMGKSAIARHIALSLSESDSYQIFPVERPGEIIKYFKTDCNQIFLIDDIGGKFCAETNIVDLWEKNENKLKDIFRKASLLKIIATCRSQIFNEEKFKTIVSKFGMRECDLKSKDYLTSTEEKRKIASCHCDENIISQLADDIVNQFDMFPLLCVTFSSSQAISLDLFINPHEQIQQEIKEMRSRNEDCFVGLVLLVLFNNKLRLSLLKDRKNRRLDKICEGVFEICELKNKPIKHRILPALQSLNQTYTAVSQSAVTAVHDKIFDMIAYYMGSHFIELILEHGSSRLICQRILLESLNLEHNEYTIIVGTEYEDIYFQRILTDVKLNKLISVFENNQMKHPTFQEKFISCLSCHPDIQSIFINNQWSLSWAVEDNRKLIVDFIIDKLNKQREQKVDKHSNKEYISCIDYSDISDEETNQAITLSSKQKDSVFIDAAVDGYTNIMDILMENFDIDVNSVVMDESKQYTALTVACYNGHTDTVSVLVNKYNCDVDLKCNGESPLHIACGKEFQDIVDILLSANCDVNVRDNKQKTPLHIACEKGNDNIVSKLLQRDCDVNLCDSNGVTPLDIAHKNGHTTTEVLLQSFIDQKGQKPKRVKCSIV